MLKSSSTSILKMLCHLKNGTFDTVKALLFIWVQLKKSLSGRLIFIMNSIQMWSLFISSMWYVLHFKINTN